MSESKKSAIILAAGDGKRMKSKKPKVLMEVAFQPMLSWVLDSVKQAGIEKIAVIIGNNAELLEKELGSHPDCKTFPQAERKGTGHAVLQAAAFLEENKDGDVLVLCGDAPFMDSTTVNEAYKLHKEKNHAVTVITAEVENPFGYGRIVREKDGGLLGIVEQKDCSEEQRSIREINSGGYWFNTANLLEALPLLTDENANREYYLTRTVELIRNNGRFAGAYKSDNGRIVLGANDRRGLRELNRIATEMLNDEISDGGVDIIGEVFIQKGVKIGQDTVILPNTIIKGDTVIGEGCVIGPNSFIEDCKIGNEVTLNNVQAFESCVEDGAKVGPFVQLRPNTTLKKGVKIGDFVEVKNSVIGEKTSIAHLTYIGDSDVGAGVNFGCGCVTANYDGIAKHRTVIGDNAFIGCNTNLIAPVTVGENATTAAGTTVTKNVPANSLAIERGQMNVKENWEKNFLRKKKK
ncbi:MAG: bifunctional UDP-N-acetylglucosamine diphosphorylase/glucosamine-1-phosphate N-acetyltransferase GlmU [Oscillospiraceae bacterium]|nr:bifunctional UDP-N-acetylglucosamine diphosphorylase/glucosamine-1-phosphate N-acetyltransferase GlmU [Oscillospiraceae bacterium]